MLFSSSPALSQSCTFSNLQIRRLRPPVVLISSFRVRLFRSQISNRVSKDRVRSSVSQGVARALRSPAESRIRKGKTKRLFGCASRGYCYQCRAQLSNKRTMSPATSDTKHQHLNAAEQTQKTNRKKLDHDNTSSSIIWKASKILIRCALETAG